MWNLLQFSINIAFNKVTLKENQMIPINVTLMGKKAKMYLFYSYCYDFMRNVTKMGSETRARQGFSKLVTGFLLIS